VNQAFDRLTMELVGCRADSVGEFSQRMSRVRGRKRLIIG